MMLKRALLILAVGYTVLSRLSEFSSEACGRKVWLGVGSIWLMDVINSDGLVTTDLGRNVCHGTVATTGHFIIV